MRRSQDFALACDHIDQAPQSTIRHSGSIYPNVYRGLLNTRYHRQYKGKQNHCFHKLSHGDKGYTCCSNSNQSQFKITVRGCFLCRKVFWDETQAGEWRRMKEGFFEEVTLAREREQLVQRS